MSCPSTEKQPREPKASPFVFVVETLSRGKGVPDAARQAMRACRQAVEESKANGHEVSVAEEKIGLEGETRLRVEFADPAAGRDVYARIKQLTDGVDLVHVRELGSDSRPR